MITQKNLRNAAKLTAAGLTPIKLELLRHEIHQFRDGAFRLLRRDSTAAQSLLAFAAVMKLPGTVDLDRPELEPGGMPAPIWELGFVLCRPQTGRGRFQLFRRAGRGEPWQCWRECADRDELERELVAGRADDRMLEV